VRGIKTNETGNIGNVLELIIKKDGNVIYGRGSGTGTKNLTQFFLDSAGSDGINLGTQPSSNTSQYTFTVLFDKQAGNDYQNKTIQFNLLIGIAIPVPEACRDIDFGGKEPIFGTQKSDSINGTSQNDLIFAFEGSDIVHGNGGADCIVGADGSDALYGDGGNDVMTGGAGSDALYGGSGNDKLYGEDGSDNLVGDDNDDVLVGGAGLDGANGGNGIDTCSAEAKVQCEI
jgi:Ca2+-binding RTX toxin-like protein